MIKYAFVCTAVALIGLDAQSAQAHVSIVSGPGFANTTQEVVFGVGHGCAGADTLSVRVVLPAGVTSVRAVNSVLGPAKVEQDATGAVTAVVWAKPTTEIANGDPNYYKLTLRLKVPDQPFTTLLFPAIQTCRTAAGVETKTAWTGGTSLAIDAGPPLSGVDAGAAEDEPAPALVILPARLAGWNKYVVPLAVNNLGSTFADAQIVWVGTAAYSANPNIATVIKNEPNTQTLTTIPAGSTVWVKY